MNKLLTRSIILEIEHIKSVKYENESEMYENIFVSDTPRDFFRLPQDILLP